MPAVPTVSPNSHTQPPAMPQNPYTVYINWQKKLWIKRDSLYYSEAAVVVWLSNVDFGFQILAGLHYKAYLATH